MKRHYLVTGGAGFIGSNYVHRLVSRGEKVTVFDNFSRGGAKRNLEWLHTTFGRDSLNMIVGDVRDASLITESARDADVIVHLAGQVAVTTSVTDPRDDFESNAIGTFNTLESARLSERNHPTEYAEFRWAGAQSWEPIPPVAADQEQLAAYVRARERLQPIPEALSESDRARLRALGYLEGE